MSVTSLTSPSQAASPLNRMTANLEKNGLSADTATEISSEISAVVKDAKVNTAEAPDKESIRAAIDEKIASDVKAGTLTQDQADAVTKTLDAMDAQSQNGGPGKASGGTPPAGTPPPGGGTPPAGGGGGGGGGGSSGSSETVVSTTSTTSGNVTTTVTTYGDGSKKTSTSYGTSASSSADSNSNSAMQTLKDMLSSNSSLSSTDQAKASDYLTGLLSGGLVNTTA